ncbi:Plug domain-containing protein [Methylobacterium sp. CB376]|uniref:TonB-dependent receptor plug domain-containing protein n=1 Tax=unclassified Methylobacterium TaxID=2615210 RepID=UPI000152E7F4|nr:MULTISPECIES: Plug domain-containing protein [Methylobacterium]WFT80489.1 Plug domain-containing protein [Methylobacterium nodulans]
MLSTGRISSVFVTTIATFVGFPALSQPAGGEIKLDEVIITSNKREQRLDRVDASVTAVTAARLADNDVRDVSDLQKVLPGIVIESRGNRAYANFTVRGISSPDFYNPVMQVYVDGVPQASANLAQDLFDVGRIELLRGPQGTLYGMNAFAGVLNIATEKPRFARADVFGTASERLFEIGTLTTSVLIPDAMFLDLGFKERSFTGQIRDIDRHRDDVDWWNGLGGRAALRYAPLGSAFDASLIVSHAALARGDLHPRLRREAARLPLLRHPVPLQRPGARDDDGRPDHELPVERRHLHQRDVVPGRRPQPSHLRAVLPRDLPDRLSGVPRGL